jgi:site-specific DNA recombinase
VSQYIGYIRVSTTKQGEGVSLEVQQDAIARYAERNGFVVGLWLEEKETAAKRGRPVFTQVIKLLRQRKYRGIILHKLDRGFRNLKEWAEIGELSDQGVEVHFVNESLDLHSRGGRLSADIQAVVAADYIRNLREETRKGFYGRLKQGLYPLPAPIGYLDQGKGKAKAVDPLMGPLIRKAFELYGTAAFNLQTLGAELYRLGLRTRAGRRVNRSTLSVVLNNPFYMGIIRLKRTGEHFNGVHEPLITKALFERVNKVLTGKVNTRTNRHAFQYRRMLSCASCGYSLVGELQKGHVYYRCHGKQCRQTSVREEVIEMGVVQLLRQLHFNEAEKGYFKSRLTELSEGWRQQRENQLRNLKLQLERVNDRLNRLTDAYLDQALDKAMFEIRKATLLAEQKSVEENLTSLHRQNTSEVGRVEKFLELLGNASLSHELATPDEKREMVRVLTSNLRVDGKKLELRPSIPFHDIVNRSKSDDGAPYRAIPRTWDKIFASLVKLNALDQLPDLSTFQVVQKQCIESPEKQKAWKHDENGKFLPS